MKVLVTGGAGFIGSHLVDNLLAKGEKVVCVDNFLLGSKKNLENVLDNKRFSLYIFDLLELEKLDHLFREEKFDMVYHLAANSDIKLGHREERRDLDFTFLTTFNVLNCMKKYDVKEILFASSSAVYGELNGSLSESSDPLFPISLYGAAKLASEAYISGFQENYGIKAWIIRFPNVVGWRLTHGVIYDFLNRLEKDKSKLLVLGDGKQQKPYLYIDDLILAIDCIYEKSKEKMNYFNVSGETETSVERIVDIVVHELGLKDIKITYTGQERGWIGDVPRFKYDTKKIQELNWKSSMTSDEAVRLSVQKELQNRKICL
jgi:UDP-glucose 4-epimerase